MVWLVSYFRFAKMMPNTVSSERTGDYLKVSFIRTLIGIQAGIEINTHYCAGKSKSRNKLVLALHRYSTSTVPIFIHLLDTVVYE